MTFFLISEEAFFQTMKGNGWGQGTTIIHFYCVEKSSLDILLDSRLIKKYLAHVSERHI